MSKRLNRYMIKMPLESKQQWGFSLLEVLIALGILATSLTYLLGSQNGAFLASQRAYSITQATLLAQTKMSEIESELDNDLKRRKFPENSIKESGNFDEPYEDWSFIYEVRKIELPDLSSLTSASEEASDAAESNTDKNKASSPSALGGDNVFIQNYIKNVTDMIENNIREVVVTVHPLGDPEDPDSITLTSHLVRYP